jgi:tripartite-type tricarboxylate transporter receptor subunit TctC
MIFNLNRIQKLNCSLLVGLLFIFFSGFLNYSYAEDNWPSKPIRIILGVAPGGATDIQARIYAQKLSQEYGQSFIVENRPGAGEVVAIQTVVKANPDGYTLLAVTPSFTIVPAYYDKPPFDPIKDFSPISVVTKAPYLVVVPAESQFKTIKDLLNFVKNNPDHLNFGTAGLNSPPQLGASWVGSSLGSSVTIINYKGTGPALVALLASETHVIFANPISSLNYVNTGKLRALAVTGAERIKALSNIPTLAESGLTGFEVTTWHGWLFPKGTPPDIVKKLQVSLSLMVNSAEVSQNLTAEGGQSVGSTSEEFRDLLSTEMIRWKSIIKLAKLKVSQ